MATHHENGKRMLQHKKRAPATTVTDTTDTEAVTTTARGRARTTATTVATTEDTATRSTRQRPSFLTATDRSTTAAAVTTSATTPDATTSSVEATTSATTRARAATTPDSDAASSQSSVASSSSASGTTRNNNNNSAESTDGGSSNGGAIAGAIIAVVIVVALALGYFFWRRRRAARAARGSGTGLIGGGAGSGNASYRKQDEGDDGMFGTSRDNSSLFGGREKTFSGEGMPHNNGGGGGGYGSTNEWNQSTATPASQQWSNAPLQPSYPPSSGPLPPSTANLLSNNPTSASSASLPFSAAAGAAGFGAARIVHSATNSLSSEPQHHQNNFDSNYHQSIENRELQQELDNRRMSMMNKTQPPVPVGDAADAQSPFGDSEGQGEIRIVKGTFDPSLDDELVLYPGDKVQVLMKYDDGWALGLNLSSGIPPAKGVFPFDCLGEVVPAPSSSEIRTAGSAPRSLSPSGGPPQLSPINPANIPLPPPTPDLLSPIAEDESPPRPSSSNAGPPQLAPLARTDSPLSPDFPPSALAPPTSPSANRTTGKTEKLKRHSSLIASRDADLFVALGEVLDKDRH